MNKVLYITENILYGLQIGKLILLKKNELLLFIIRQWISISIL